MRGRRRLEATRPYADAKVKGVKAWWRRIEQLVPMMLDKAEQDGGIVVANLGQKCLPEGRVVLVHTSSQACAAGCRWGAHQRR